MKKYASNDVMNFNQVNDVLRKNTYPNSIMLGSVIPILEAIIPEISPITSCLMAIYVAKKPAKTERSAIIRKLAFSSHIGIYWREKNNVINKIIVIIPDTKLPKGLKLGFSLLTRPSLKTIY